VEKEKNTKRKRRYFLLMDINNIYIKKEPMIMEWESIFSIPYIMIWKNEQSCVAN